MKRRSPGKLNPALNDALFRTGKPQRQIAIAIGMSEGRLSHAVRGRVVLTADEKIKLAIYLRRPIEELFPDDDADDQEVEVAVRARSAPTTETGGRS